MTLADLHHAATLLQIALAALTVLALLRVRAPYGRHARPGWGPLIPARLGWILMEAPAPLGFAWWAFREGAPSGAAALLAALFLLHYVHRTFIFPFRIRATGKTMPASIAAMAILFNLLNSFVQGAAVGGLVPATFGPHLVVGAALFLVGLAINLWADQVLIRLRRHDDGYHIPHGGLYRWISCPNYFGEILEWTGWAIATASLPGLAFALYTAANLAPRAVDHHRWYHERFPDYPPDRKALVPGLL